MKDDELFAFAGLWEHWENDESIDSCTILTTQANELVKPIHDRMPVIVLAGDYGRWLDPAAKPKCLKTVLRPYDSDGLVTLPVSRLVNSPKNDSPQCVEPLQE